VGRKRRKDARGSSAVESILIGILAQKGKRTKGKKRLGELKISPITKYTEGR